MRAEGKKTYTYRHPHPAVTTDIAIFSLRAGELKVLLVQRAEEPYRGAWALPGGFVQIDEDLIDAARRELEEETGVTDVTLEQLYTFGKPDRDPRERVITVAYYTLAPSETLEIRAASDASSVSWFSMKELPRLAFDHDEILSLAHERLVAKLERSTIAFQFVPEEFTLDELRKVHEIVLGESVDKRNFRKKILSLGQIEETGGVRRDSPHRPAKLYRALDRSRPHLTK